MNPTPTPTPSTKARKCVWSGRHDPGSRAIVPVEVRGDLSVWTCAAHEEETRRFLRYQQRFAPVFFAGLVLALARIFLSYAIESNEVLSGFVALLGITVTFFPFTTPQTVALFGMRNSIRIARLSGLAILAIAMMQLLVWGA